MRSDTPHAIGFRDAKAPALRADLSICCLTQEASVIQINGLQITLFSSSTKATSTAKKLELGAGSPSILQQCEITVVEPSRAEAILLIVRIFQNWTVVYHRMISAFL